MRGLDPRIHLSSRSGMDCRVEPGNDVVEDGVLRALAGLAASSALARWLRRVLDP
jgi:hypothetical protein